MDGGVSWNVFNNGLPNGFINTLAIDPQTPAIIYAGTLGGGVFSMYQLELEEKIYLPLILRQ